MKRNKIKLIDIITLFSLTETFVTETCVCQLYKFHLSDVRDEKGERFHYNIKVMEEWKIDIKNMAQKMMAD